MKLNLRGCYSPIPTFFKEEGTRAKHPVHVDAMHAYIDHLHNNGSNGIVVCGCTGSDAVLSPDEQVDLAKEIQSNWGRHTTIIVGDGSNATHEALSLAHRMEKEAKIYHHLSICPYKVKASDRGLIDHYRMIVDNTEGEHIPYTVKSRTGGKGLSPVVVKVLAEHDRIPGMKESDGSIDKVREIIDATRDMDFVVLLGEDPLILEGIRLGAKGAISATSDVDVRRVSSMVHHALDGRYDEAKRINDELKPLYEAMFPRGRYEYENPSPNPVMAHYALNQMGFAAGYPRLPLTDGELHEREIMDDVLKRLELV